MVPKADRAESAKPFDIRHRTIGFGVAPAGFLNLVLVQYFLTVSMFLCFGMVMYILYQCTYSIMYNVMYVRRK